jgi:hypothetical protein
VVFLPVQLQAHAALAQLAGNLFLLNENYLWPLSASLPPM